MRLRSWLALSIALVVAMVVVGGVTRLSGSGLSIVEWAPAGGVIPPLSEGAWHDAFAAYRRSPEGLVRSELDVGSFKTLFLIEWGHRLLARITGLVLALPLFLRFGAPIRRRALLVVILVALQAVAGWWMVSSGLRDVPSVSPYRLAIHLSLALAILAVLVDTWLDRPGVATARARVLLALVSIAVVSGAAMAGTRGGYLFATFPTMNGAWVPPGAFAADPFSDPLTAHVVHRAMALVVLVAALAARARVVAAAVVLQIALGAATVMLHVPLAVATLHQLGGVVVFATAVANLTRTRRASAARGDDPSRCSPPATLPHPST